jgi:hypothetical protein
LRHGFPHAPILGAFAALVKGGGRSQHGCAPGASDRGICHSILAWSGHIGASGSTWGRYLPTMRRGMFRVGASRTAAPGTGVMRARIPCQLVAVLAAGILVCGPAAPREPRQAVP